MYVLSDLYCLCLAFCSVRECRNAAIPQFLREAIESDFSIFRLFPFVFKLRRGNGMRPCDVIEYLN